MIRRKAIVFFCLIASLTIAVYGNHFNNDFHFDDSHTIVENPAIRSTGNLVRFFADATTSSVMPEHWVWRPLVYVSLALDYGLGKGLVPFWFHLDTFFWFLVLLGLMLALFLKLLEGDLTTAALATSLFAVHPAMAETVNYVIQRADLYSTLGVVAAMAVWALAPAIRRDGLYLLPFITAVLAKPPALIFPAMLFLYIWLIEKRPLRQALGSTLPSLAVGAALAWFSGRMIPSSAGSWNLTATEYRITQPIVIFRYFRIFFWPVDLSADTDRKALASLWDPQAALGLVFLVALVAIAALCASRRKTVPIAFGLFWFLLAVLPTSLYPLAEVENDHRMFFPFVGLALSVAQALRLAFRALPIRREAAAGVYALVLIAFAAGTRQRNEVWRSDESLWLDVTQKSPGNGRGLMNYGVSLMLKGDNSGAIPFLTRAKTMNPGLYKLDMDLGIVKGKLGADAEAESHFEQAAMLAPQEASVHYFYAVWLREKDRLDDALTQLKIATQSNSSNSEVDHLLMDIYAQRLEKDHLRETAQRTLVRYPADAEAREWLGRIETLKPGLNTWLGESRTLYRQGKFAESMVAARKALELNPGSSEAWNRIAAASSALSMWDDAIAASEHALRYSPDDQTARDNRASAESQKAGTATRR